MNLSFLRKLLPVALTVCLFLLIVGAKWATFERFGSPMPDWDQWDAEAVKLFIPWYENDNFLSHLFHPHNEHRVVLTKLQNLTLGVLNGQWDSRLEAVSNALLHAALAAGFWLLGRRSVDGRWHAPLFGLAVLLFALPVAWQNVLGGFHSQQYWLQGLSFITLVLLPTCPTGSGGWWLGLTAASLALVSMGSGLLAPAMAIVVVGFRAWRRRDNFRNLIPTLAPASALVMLGIFTRAVAENHAPLKAQNVSDFVFSTLHSLQWPLRHADWAGPLMWAPWALVAYAMCQPNPPSRQRSGWALVGLGLWVLVQIAATAYARGAGAEYPASRYQDTLVFGAMTNGIALTWLLSAHLPGVLTRRRTGLLAVLWLTGLGVGLYQNLWQAFYWDLGQAKRYYVAAEANLRRYLTTRDVAELDSPDIPYPSVEALVERINHPVVRGLMPVPLRPPITVIRAEPAAGKDPAIFLENDIPPRGEIWPLQHGLSFNTPALDGARTWGSYSRGGAAAVGEWRSQPIIPPRFAWLKFETAGAVGEPGVALELRDARTDALLATIKPTRVPHDSWRAAYVRTPAVPFVLVARDTDTTRWLAFSPPVEMGALSYLAWQATKHGLLIAGAAAGAAVFFGLASLALGRFKPPAA